MSDTTELRKAQWWFCGWRRAPWHGGKVIPHEIKSVKRLDAAIRTSAAAAKAAQAGKDVANG